MKPWEPAQLCARHGSLRAMTRKPNLKSRGISSATVHLPAWKSWSGLNKRWLVAGEATAGLLGSALFNRAAAGRTEAATPAAGTFVEVDGVRLHYVDRGAGPAVVLLHRNGVMLQDFEASGVLGLAAEHHRVIAFDRPGFGYSDRPRTTVWTSTAQAELITPERWKR